MKTEIEIMLSVLIVLCIITFSKPRKDDDDLTGFI